jgi:CheY-like chemotaxis protein
LGGIVIEVESPRGIDVTLTRPKRN